MLDFSSSGLLSALSSIIGIALSGLISWFVSRASAEREIRKLKVEWEHEDLRSLSADFSDMISSVAVYLSNSNQENHEKALSLVATVRAKETGLLAAKLDILFVRLYYKQGRRIDEALTSVIDEHRKESRQ